MSAEGGEGEQVEEDDEEEGKGEDSTEDVDSLKSIIHTLPR